MSPRPRGRIAALPAYLGFVLFLCAFATRAAEPLVVEGIVNAPTPEVWRLFTTAEGMRSWMVPHAEIDLRIGGLMRTRYGTDGTLGDEQTIVNEILAYEPERMLSLRVHQAPKDFPFTIASKQMWTVIYFQPLEPGMTNIRIVGLGFTDEDESKRMRRFFAEGNAQTLETLQKKFWPSCASCKADPAP